MQGATLGIIGLGRIGQGLARRASGFQMRVLYYDARRRPDLESTAGVEYVELEALYRRPDFISVHTDLNESTRHMLRGRTS